MFRFLITILLCIVFLTVFGQEKPSYKKLRFYPADTEDTYIGFSAAAQIWARYIENNPGTLVNSTLESTTYDISIRRFRLGIYGQVFSKIRFKFQVGENNINYLSNREKQIHVIDAYVSYRTSKYNVIGIGKTAWTGLSRYSVPSTRNALGVDVPIFALPTVGITDDLLRKMSVFTHGIVGKLDYRFSISKPFLVSSENLTEYASFSNKNPELQSTGYLKYQFFQNESQTSAFSRGTYAGTKTIFNVGVGFLHQPEAMAYVNSYGERTVVDMSHFAIDMFLEIMLSKSTSSSLTVYAAQFNYNFGPGYIRNIGVNNPSNGINEGGGFNGRGNAFPAIGTGNVSFLQIGYLFPQKGRIDHNANRFQAYASIQYADYERLASKMSLYEWGVNYILNPYSKITLGYQSRPIFDYEGQVKPEEVARKGMFVMQLQLNLN